MHTSDGSSEGNNDMTCIFIVEIVEMCLRFDVSIILDSLSYTPISITRLEDKKVTKQIFKSVFVKQYLGEHKYQDK